MSNDTNEVFARILKLLASILKMVVDGKRDAVVVADSLQKIVDEPKVEVAEPTEKFEELADLGYIIVPDGDPATCLARFAENNREKCWDFNNNITDVNFPNPSRVLKPGDKIRIRVIRQAVSGTTTSEERMDFLRKQKGNVFVGAQGSSYAFEQKRAQLPKGYWYASFDEKDRLWYSDGYHRVADVCRDSVGGFRFSLGDFERVWDGGSCLLCFCDESLDA